MPDDTEDQRLQKLILLVTTILISIAGIVWGFVYYLFDEPVAALIPLAYSVLSVVNLAVLGIFHSFPFFRFTQLLLILFLPALLMTALGGFVEGSAVILWGLLAPIGALLCGRSRAAYYWSLAYLATVVLSAVVQPYLRSSNNLPHGAVLLFFVINVAAVSTTILLVLKYFVNQKEQFIDLMRKTRELEKEYLQQEVMLRQSEKLATLGRLSAGMAHEINNPAAAALRGVKQIRDKIGNLERIQFELGEMGLTQEQRGVLDRLRNLIEERAKQPDTLDALTRSDREREMETWLEEKNISDPWEWASMLVDVGLDLNELSELAELFNAEQLPTVISSLGDIFVTRNLLEEMGQGASRITEIVKALKSYSYVDRAPIQSLDIHEGLNNTLVMMRSQLKKGVVVHRDFDEGLPKIEACGNELNQVWTNIIDNAVHALNGQGEIGIKTFQDDGWIVVQIKDNGPGIPEEIQPKIFDPFFTTKTLGEGTGLGLNISHNIIVQKHNGKISVRSRPGETCFEIRLPTRLEEVGTN